MEPVYKWYSLRIACFLLVTMASLSSAEDGDTSRYYVDGSGKRYAYERNQHGAILRVSGEEIYLGVSCDAFSTRRGEGEWSWANGGFWVTFQDERIFFPRQELNMDNNGGCRSSD